jgi:hypothetical protein
MPMKNAGLILLALFLPALAVAESAPGVGTTSANFLKLGSSARPAALGEAFVSLADESGGLAYNPAGLLSMNQSEIQATHTSWFKGVNFEELGLSLAVRPGTAMGFAFSYVGLPSQPRTVATGANSSDPLLNFKDIGTFSPYDMHLAVAYARLWGTSWKTGGTLNVTSQSVAGATAMGLGLDLGLIGESGIDNLNWGFAIQNLGFAVPLVKESFGLPMLFRLGADYRVGPNLLFTTEMDMPNDNSFGVGVGGEFNFEKYVFLRLGYRYDSIFNPFSAGMGFKMNSAKLDLVWVPAGELGQTYRGSLSYRWGGWVTEERSADLKVVSGIVSKSPGAPSAPFRLQPMVREPKQVKDWSLEILRAGEGAVLQKRLSGLGPFGAEVEWDGSGEGGAPAPDGAYDAVLKVQFNNGQAAVSPPRRLLLNPPLPDSAFEIDANSVAAGQPDTVYVPTDIHVQSVATALPLRWRMVWTGPDNKVFNTVEGPLGEAMKFQWSGANEQGEQFYSNSVYQISMSLIDEKGQVVKAQAPISRKLVFRR